MEIDKKKGLDRDGFRVGGVMSNRMYAQRPKQGNISVFRGCGDKDGWWCQYCNFERLVKLNTKCPACASGLPHSHMEILKRNPPKTLLGQFLTVGLSGEISNMHISEFKEVIEYCTKWGDRTFWIQSKDPSYFVAFEENGFSFPDNVIICTTIETNRNTFPAVKFGYYSDISKAPHPEKRYNAMRKLTCRTAITIEPMVDFDVSIMLQWMRDIKPEIIHVGYCNDGHEGKRLKLPEPNLSKVRALILELREDGMNVVEKSMRKAWWEN